MAHISQCYLNPLQVYVTWESCFHCSWNASHFTCTQHEHCSLGFHITGSCHDDLHVELLMVSDVGPISLLALCDWVATLERGGGCRCLQCAHVGDHVTGKATMNFMTPSQFNATWYFTWRRELTLLSFGI